ncbi:MAG: hypothetical protein GY923_18215, partial [Aestuariibacter sp.]|nr:hypothetical protein [Aestuariibacter sp.]
NALAALVPRLPDPLIKVAVDGALAIKHESSCAEALAALVPRLPDAKQDQLLHEALGSILGFCVKRLQKYQ